MRSIILSSLTVCCLTLTGLVSAEQVVIVSAGNTNNSLDKKTISRIFLGKANAFPDGSQAIPLDQSEGSASREAFNDQVLEKSASQLKAYWSRLIFTGKGTPPKESGSDSDVKSLIANNPNLLGYVDSSVVDDSVKVVYRFN